MVARSNLDLRGAPGDPDLLTISGISAAKTNVTELLDERFVFAQTFPYRGRGPIWHANSCSLDCCIVAARLLNVGITLADKGPTPTNAAWLSSLHANVRSFLDLVVNGDWEIMNARDNINIRHHFLRNTAFHAVGQQWAAAAGALLPAANLWDRLTEAVGQFEYRTSTLVSCYTCNAQYIHPPTDTGNATGSLAITQAHLPPNAKPSMEFLLNRQFISRPPDPLNVNQQRRPCSRCNATHVTSRQCIIHGSLPLRLVVAPDNSYTNIAGATSDAIRVRYVTSDREIRLATYRWLGGIYNAANHFRLYWTDCGPNDQTDNLKVYDGLRVSGAIVGGVAPHKSSSTAPRKPEDRVPPYWSNRTTLLFYERTSDVADQPETSTVQRAAIATPANTSGNLSTPQDGSQGRPGGSTVGGNTGQNVNGANLNRGDPTAIDLTSDEAGSLPGPSTTPAGSPPKHISKALESGLKHKASVTSLTDSPPSKKIRVDATEVQIMTEIQTQTFTERSIEQTSYEKAQKQMQDQQALLATTLPKIKKESIDLTDERTQPPITNTNTPAAHENSHTQTLSAEEPGKQPSPHYMYESEIEYQHYQSLFQTSIQTPDLSTSSNSISLNSQASTSGFMAEEVTMENLETELRTENPQWLPQTSNHSADLSTSSNSTLLNSQASSFGFLAEEVTMEDFEGELGQEESLLDIVIDKVSETVEKAEGFLEQ